MTKQKATVEILSLLNSFDVVERIDIIERIGKRLRQANSIQSAKEVKEFTTKKGIKKDIDYSPVLKNNK